MKKQMPLRHPFGRKKESKKTRNKERLCFFTSSSLYIFSSFPLHLFISLSLYLFASLPLFASESLLDSANNAYAQGNFKAASEHYEQILAKGYEAPELYFNLGNAYFKMGKTGKAILNYERAKKLAPKDEDIAFNLKLANERTVDRIEPAPKLFLDEWWDNIKAMQTEKTWAWRSIICFVLFLFFLGVFLISPASIQKQFGFWLAIVFFFFSATGFIVAKSRHRDSVSKNEIIIMVPSAEIKNAPSEAATRLFILREGAKAPATETGENWVRIELSPEKVGWVKKEQVEFI